MPAGHCCRYAQAGQALTETLVFAALAATLCVAALMIGRLQSVQTHAIDAARALALECRLAHARCGDPSAQSALVAVLKERHFGSWPTVDPSGRAQAGPPDAERLNGRSFWRLPDGSPMLGEWASIRLQSRAEPLDAGIHTAIAGRTVVAEALARYAGPERFGLDPRAGLRVAEVDVPVKFGLSHHTATTDAPALELRLRAKVAVLGDEWNAASTYGGEADSVRSRVQRGKQLDSAREGVLAAGYSLTRGALRMFEAIGLEPRAGALLDHELDVGIIPGDRRP